MAAGRQQLHEKHVTPDPDPDSEDEPDGKKAFIREHTTANESGESDTDPCPYFDVSTNEMCARLMSLTLADTPAARQHETRAPSSTSNEDASAKLANFRPICEGIETLKQLLEARADPDVVLGPGHLSPLRNVICFAHKDYVSPMRELLLKHGARESRDDKKRWEIRKRADTCEKAWLKNFHKDERA